MGIRKLFLISFFCVAQCELYKNRATVSVKNGNLFINSAGSLNLQSSTNDVKINNFNVMPLLLQASNASTFVNQYQKLFSTYVDRLEALESKSYLDVVPANLSNSDLPDNFQLALRRLNRRVLGIQRTLATYKRLIQHLSIELITDNCLSNPCKNGAVCQDLFNGFFCKCRDGWEGPTCDADVNECARFAGTDLGCQNGATCNNQQGTYQCLCPQGWYGIHCNRRSTDCLTGGTELCGHGICVSANTNLGYTCICDAGWKTDGINMACNVDVDECQQKHLACSTNPMVACVNIPGSFVCGPCPIGYTGTGFYCTDINECEINNGGCSVSPMVKCINTPGSRTCGPCPAGYIGDGTACSYTGVCQINNGGCHFLARCQENSRISSTFVQCICPPQYIGTGIGPNGCVPKPQNLHPCAPNPCAHGTCIPVNNSDGYVCNCWKKFIGKNCDIPMDPCVPSPCQNGGTCTNLAGANFACQCIPGFYGKRCQNERQTCGGFVSGKNGTLQYPAGNSVNIRSQTVSCAWVISVNQSKTINVTFDTFSTTGSDSGKCKNGFVQIYDGENTASKLLGRFCGNQLPLNGSFATTGHQLYLWLRIPQGGRVNFKLNWTAAEPSCGGLIENIAHGKIESPGSPFNYPNNRDCVWTLIAPEGKRFLFHFYSLDIGQNPTCGNDYLEFFDLFGATQEGQSFSKICNSTLPDPLYSPGRIVTIHFHSDEKDTHLGFQITFSTVEGIPGCGGIYTNNMGSIHSPSNVPDDQGYIDCEYRIRSPEGSNIKMTFTQINTTCPQGVTIYEGSMEDGQLIGRYCGEELQGPLTSQSKEILILSKANAGLWSLNYERECHKIYTEGKGSITFLPSMPACTIEIRQPVGYVIVIDITYNITGSINIYDGDSDKFPVLASYSGNHIEGKDRVMSQINNVIIKTHNALWNQLDIKYTSIFIGCGGILTDKIGSIKSPAQPDGTYPVKKTCKWIVKAPPGFVIQITFLTFHLEESASCSYDNVKLFDNNTDPGMGGLLGTYCGSLVPPSTLSSSNVMTVVFTTDDSIQMNGFSASYIFLQEKDVCGGNYFSSAGVVRSPGFPLEYPSSKVCSWTITAPPGNQILLNVTTFDIESFANCKCDYIEIRNGGTSASPLIGKYCGNTIPKQIFSHTNKMFILFRSDVSKNGKGFEIYWSSTSTGCGGLLTSPTGTIISPNYPEPYDRSTDCIWKISVNAGSRIQAVLGDIDVEDHNSCALDFLEIYDGNTRNSKSLGRFCNPNKKTLLTSTKNTLLVRFRSDISEQGRGFQLIYSTLCDNVLRGFRGVIESPNFPNEYPTNQDCRWTIIVPPKNNISITFSHFDVGAMGIGAMDSTTRDSCSTDNLEIKYYIPNEDDEDEPLITKSAGKFCGDKVPDTMTINASHAEVIFHSDYHFIGNGFRLEWELSGCGGLLTENSGVISSPNYPESYPDGIECDWQIEVDLEYSIELTFIDINLEHGSDCPFDFISVYNNINSTDNLISKLCYQVNSTVVTSSSNIMYIQFISDVSHRGTGFKANYSMIPKKCGGKMQASSGIISSPNYPNPFTRNDTCEWELEVGNSHTIEIQFTSVHLVSHPNCSYSYVKIYDGPSEGYPLLATACKLNYPNETIRSSYNQVYVVFKGGFIPSKGFSLTFKESCGSRISTQGSGIIENTPGRTYNYDSNCTWIISALDPTQHISLTITHINSKVNYYPGNPIKVYAGEFYDSPLIGEYGGLKIPPTIYSDNSVIRVTALGDVIFSASYSVVDSQCGGTLTALEGHFTTPHYPKRYPSDVQCEWTIPLSPGNHMTLYFTAFDIPESENCNEDFVEVRQNNQSGKLYGAFCGTSLPANIKSDQSLWILFKSSKLDGTTPIKSTGFLAGYSLDKFVNLTGTHGTIATPWYPKLVDFSMVLQWSIIVSSSKKILLTFRDFYIDLQYSSYASINDCWGSNLEVFDGIDSSATSLGSFCGTRIPDPIKSSSNSLFIVLTSSDSRSGAKLNLDWLEISESLKLTTLQPANVTGCGSSKVIEVAPYNVYNLISPGYPNGYAPNLNCEWIFSTIPINQFQILFVSTDFAESSVISSQICNHDYVEVYTQDEIKDNNWKLLKRVCRDEYHSIQARNLAKVVFKTNGFFNGTGFTASIYSVCGGTLDLRRESVGEISYNISGGRPTRCQWNVTARSGRTIKMQIISLDINKDETCSSYLMVRNGKFPDSPLLGKGKYCGNETFEPVTSMGNNMYLKFSSKSQGSSIRLKFEEISPSCGGDIRLIYPQNSTVISSPNYPQIPLPHTECVWRIIAPTGESLQIDFEGFDMVCNGEYIELRDGATATSPIIKEKLCYKLPSTQYTTDNILYVKFFTDIDDPSSGFKARVSITVCGGTFRELSGQVRSPVLGLRQALNCTWNIIAPVSTYVVIKFTKFDLGITGSCAHHSHLLHVSQINEFTQNKTILGSFCGSTIPPAIISSTRMVTIVYQHFPNVIFKTSGFVLTFKAEEEVCYGKFTQPEGIITTPGYPNMNTNFRSCQWTIEVPKGRRVTFEVLDFDIDTKSDYSGLLLWDDFNYRLNSAHIKPGDTQRIFESSDNKMSVFLGFSLSLGHRGFKARFSSNNPTICVGDFNQTSGTMSEIKTTPSYICDWEHDARSTHETLAMSVTLQAKPRKSATSNCKFSASSLIISNNKKGILKSLCKTTDNPVSVRSPYPVTKLHVISATSSLNFTLSYKTHLCGGIRTNQMDTISSPGFPNKPIADIECAWLVKVGSDERIKVQISQITWDEDCNKGSLIFFNGELPSDPHIFNSCNGKIDTSKLIITQKNTLLIEYKYQKGSTMAFNISYEAVDTDCGGTFNARSMIIQSPSYGKEYPNNAECLWDIVSNNGYHVKLTFIERFYIAQSADCKDDFVEIFDWKDDKWISLGKKCGRVLPDEIRSSGEKMRILFRSNDKTSATGFKAIWNWQCGGQYEATEQPKTIVSPGYPDGYEGSLKCIYNITSKNIVNVVFEDFELERIGIPGCKFDNVTIRNSYVRQRVYCGKTMPPPQREAKFIIITFMTDSHLNRKGFKFTYKDDSCGGEMTKPGIIQMKSDNSTGIFSQYRYNIQRKTCIWKIRAPADKLVVLSVDKLSMDSFYNCFLQKVEIYKSWNATLSNKLASLCGEMTDSPTVHSDNNEMLVRSYVNLARFRNFEATVRFTNGPSIGCGGKIDLRSTQTISYSRIANSSDSHYDCSWYITAPRDNQIKIDIPFHDNMPCNQTRGRDTCWSLEIRDGPGPLSELIGILRPNDNTTWFASATTSWNTAYVRFLWSQWSERTIFQVTLKPFLSICGHSVVNVTTEPQVIQSPNYPMPYPPRTKCNWIFSFPTTQPVLIHFEEFDVGTVSNSSKACGNDRVQIIEDPNNEIVNKGLGPSATYVSMNRHDRKNVFNYFYKGKYAFCGQEIPFDYYSEGRSLSVSFESKAERNSGRFKFRYSLIGCDRNYTSLQGRIYRMYSKQQNCQINIEVPSNYKISLHFNYFFFSFSTNCSNAGLEVRDGSNTGKQLLKACGAENVLPVFSTTNKLWIHVWSNLTLWSKYDITYTSSERGQGCGGVLYNYKGKFSSPMYPDNFRNNTECVWTIRVPVDHTVKITFKTFDIRGPCDKAYLQVLTFTSGVQTTRKFCSGDVPAVIESQQNAVVKYQSYPNNGGTGFLATFEETYY